LKLSAIMDGNEWVKKAYEKSVKVAIRLDKCDVGEIDRTSSDLGD